MKTLSWLLVVFAALTLFTACKKDPKITTALGTLKKGTTGDCLPSTVNGIYRVDSTLTSTNYIDIQLNASHGGTFTISTDTVNGYSFNKSGRIGDGLNTIRLYAVGKPITAGVNIFTIKYDTSVCTIAVTVFGTTSGSSSYTLGGAPDKCTGFSLSGTYRTGLTMTSANTVNFVVNVATIGTYIITTNTANGIVFSGSGTFTTTGLQGVTLTASGVPAAEGDYQYTVTGASGNCSFSISIQAGAPALYMLGGNPGSCTNVLLSGNYKSGIVTTASNTATVDVTVINGGVYSLTTNTQNGVSFSATGTFLITGAQQVTLKATGTPLVAGNFVYTISGASTTCSFPVTFTAPAPPAGYTLACAGAVVNGAYYKDIPLAATNTVVFQVNVATLGAYNITTNTVNGMSFKGTGNFTVTGPQTVTLTASGIPTIIGNTNLTVTTDAGATCNFPVTTTLAPPAVFTSDCPSIKVNGNYYISVPLTAANTVTIAVNVSAGGSYTIATATVNGITFSKSGVFYLPYPTTITLNATGIPTLPGINSFSVVYGASACPFLVNVLTGSAGIFTCKIDGVFTDLSDQATASIDVTSGTSLHIEGYVARATSPENFMLNLAKPTGGSIPAGTYVNTLNEYLAGYQVSPSYFDAAGATHWFPTTPLTGNPDPFSITITSITATNVKGTFSGTVRDLLLGGTHTKTVTEGVFNVPVQ